MPKMLEAGEFGTGVEREVNSVVAEKMGELNLKTKRRPLTKFEKDQIESGANNPFFIYNVSPVHEWARPQGQLGTIMILRRLWLEDQKAKYPKEPWRAVFSDPAVIPGITLRWIQAGVSQLLSPFIESGREITEDVCGFGPSLGDAHPNRDLSRYGVFITERPLAITDNVWAHLSRTRQQELQSQSAKEKYLLSQSEREEAIDTAKQFLVQRLQETILEADNYFDGGPEMRKFVQRGGPVYKDSLRAFNEITGQKVTRQWTTLAFAEIETKFEECAFCGTKIKVGLAKCPNCKEIVNAELYAKLQKKTGAA